MPRASHPTPARRRGRLSAAAITVVVGAVAAVAVGCGGDGQSGAVTSLSAADCPFSGAADPVEGGTGEPGASTLTGIDTAKDGCVDVVTLRFDGGEPARWTAAYADAAVLDARGDDVVPGGAEALVVTVHGATSTVDGGTVAAVGPGPLDYVEGVVVVPLPDDDELRVVLGLPERLPFDVGGSDGEGLEVRTG